MSDFDPNFLPVLLVVAAVLAVEAALAIAAVAGLWMIAASLVAALDASRHPGELALALAGVAAVLVAAGWLGWLVTNSRRKD